MRFEIPSGINLNLEISQKIEFGNYIGLIGELYVGQFLKEIGVEQLPDIFSYKKMHARKVRDFSYKVNTESRQLTDFDALCIYDNKPILFEVKLRRKKHLEYLLRNPPKSEQIARNFFPNLSCFFVGLEGESLDNQKMLTLPYTRDKFEKYALNLISELPSKTVFIVEGKKGHTTRRYL